MLTFPRLKKLLKSSNCLSDIIECALEVDWSAEYNNRDNHNDCLRDIGDIICGLYWYCVENHSGQWSDTYKLQCILGDIYTPGHCEKGPEEDSCSMNVYTQLNELAVK